MIPAPRGKYTHYFLPSSPPDCLLSLVFPMKQPDMYCKSMSSCLQHWSPILTTLIYLQTCLPPTVFSPGRSGVLRGNP